MATVLMLPTPVHLTTQVSPDDALQRLAAAVAKHEVVEPSVPPRQLTGRIAGQRVRLHMGPMWFGHVGERNSFQVEFRGEVQPDEQGAVLRGQIDLRARTALTWLRWIFQAWLVLFGLVAILIAAGTGAWAMLIITAAAWLGVWLVPKMMEAGEASGVRDARTLLDYLERLLS